MIPSPHRFLIICLILPLLLLLLWVRAGYLQLIQHDFFKSKSSQQLRRIIKVYPQRGHIFDRNKQLLASVIPSYALYALPKEIDNKWDFAHLVAPILQLDPTQLQRRLYKTPASFIWIQRHCTPKQVAQLKQLKLSGIGYIKTQKRTYPQSKLASHILGFVGIDNQGLGGLEYYYDTQLKGSKGHVLMEGSPRGLPLMSGKMERIPKYDGYHLVTTIDSFIQFSAQTHLAQGVSLNRAEKGQVIVMNPKTGGILAMASYPEMDTNDWQSVPASHRKNACIIDVYEPGSIFKPIIIASALEERLVTPGSIITVPETLQVYDRTVNEAHARPQDETDQQTVANILQKSLNVGTSLLAQQLGEKKQYYYMNAFGFGKKTNITLPGESRGILRPLKEWSRVDSAMMSFGQGVAVTSLQMASAIATIANQGRYMQPRIINYISDAQFNTRKAHPITTRAQVISPKTADMMTDIMTGVVEHGTATNVKIPGYAIAGKTGTAQKARDNGRGYEPGKYIASFVGFFPAKDPQYVILVAVDSPKRSIWGSSVAGPIFKNITLDIINYFQLLPTKPSDI